MQESEGRFCADENVRVYEACANDVPAALCRLALVLRRHDEDCVASINVTYIDEEFYVTAYC